MGPLVYVIPTIHGCSIICCVLVLPQCNVLLTRSVIGVQKEKVVPKLDSKSAPSACEAGALPSEDFGDSP